MTIKAKQIIPMQEGMVIAISNALISIP